MHRSENDTYPMVSSSLPTYPSHRGSFEPTGLPEAAQEVLFSHIAPWQGNPKCLGLIAGEGSLPRHVVNEARAQGFEVVVFSLAQWFTHDELKQGPWYSFHVGQMHRMFQQMRDADVGSVTFAGKVNKWLLFTGVRMDNLTFQMLRLMPRKNDDAMMRFGIGTLEALGLTIIPQVAFMQGLFKPEGILVDAFPLTETHWKDACFGFDLARASGGLDIGQTVVVNDTMAISIEAIEGTDACLQRAGKLLRGRGGCVAKVAKPEQDTRFDVPAVGLRTLKRMHKAGLRVLVTEAERTLFLDDWPIMHRFAMERGISVLSCTEAGLSPWRKQLRTLALLEHHGGHTF
jgi:UDP-2,3-diacylglucosamine hydrolase